MGDFARDDNESRCLLTDPAGRRIKNTAGGSAEGTRRGPNVNSRRFRVGTVLVAARLRAFGGRSVPLARNTDDGDVSVHSARVPPPG